MNYSYGNSDWKDLLTEYNGTAISYDLSGNPLNWRNASSLTWDGRRLSGMTLTDGTEIAFEYNSEGLRTGKTVGNSTVQYIWNEGNLIAEIRDGYTLKFLYNNGEAAGFSYNGADYYYGKDSFGVIHYLYNTSGEIVTTYTYDAWGTVLSVTGTLAETVGTVNPVRYKGYYLDSETGWYYLQSRYYDPAVGRFLNADEVQYLGDDDIHSCNGLFTYCENNPNDGADATGKAKCRPVGFGLQLEISGKLITMGVELIWYTESGIRNGRAWYIPYVYFYGGYGLSMDLENMLNKIAGNPSLLTAPKKLARGSASVCVFVVFGYGNFKKPSDYLGKSKSHSVTVWNAKTYLSYGEKCFTVGMGYSTSKFAVSAGVSRYVTSEMIYSMLSTLYNKLLKMSQKVKA